MKNFSLKPGTGDDAAALAAMHTAVAEHLTAAHGQGPWSSKTTTAGVLFALRNMHVFVARDGSEIIATLRLTAKKPWAIDTTYFTPCVRPLYLLSMAVTPDRQRQGIGTRCLETVKKIADKWPADAIRLDAYDAAAGAGPFYAHCGYSEMGRVVYKNAPLIYYEWLIK